MGNDKDVNAVHSLNALLEIVVIVSEIITEVSEVHPRYAACSIIFGEPFLPIAMIEVAVRHPGPPSALHEVHVIGTARASLVGPAVGMVTK